MYNRQKLQSPELSDEQFFYFLMYFSYDLKFEKRSTEPAWNLTVKLANECSKTKLFSNVLYFQKTQKMQKLLKHSRWLLKIVRWAEYDAEDGEN